MRNGLFLILVGVVFLAACGSSTPPTPTVANTPTALAPLTANPQELPLPTLLPTVAVPETAVPIPVTVAPEGLTAIPTISPIPVTAAPGELTAIPTISPIPLTATRPNPALPRPSNTPPAPAESATPFPEGMPKVYITALRVEPPTPKADVPGTFFATFQNVSGENQSYRWAVEIWDAEDNKRFGLTAPENSTMPVGVSNFTSSGWAPRGQGECRAYRGRAVALDEDDNRTTFIKPDGNILWLDFTVCP